MSGAVTRVLFVDVDGVLAAGSTEPIAPAIIRALAAQASRGVHLVPLTGQDLRNIEERFYAALRRRVPAAMRAITTAYTETGARCWVYDAARRRMVADRVVTSLFTVAEQRRLRQVRRRLGREAAFITRDRDVTPAWLSVRPRHPAQTEAIAVRLIAVLAAMGITAHVFLTATGDINAVRQTKAFGVSDYLTRRLPAIGGVRRLSVAAVVDSLGRKTVTCCGYRRVLEFNDHPIVTTRAVAGVPVRVFNVGPRHPGFAVPARVVQIGAGPEGLLTLLNHPARLWGVSGT